MKIRQMGMYDGKKTFKAGDFLKIETFNGDVWTGIFKEFSTNLFNQNFMVLILGDYKNYSGYETKLNIKEIVEIQVMK